MGVLKFDKNGKVFVIQIDSPSTLNAIEMDTMDEMIEALRRFEKDPQYGAAVITGTGRAFCTGSDLKCFAELSQEEIIKYCGDYGHELFNYIATMGKPVIAAVNGYAIGGGFELALACDLRIGSPKASFSTPEFDFGWLPGWGGVPRLAALIGSAKAKEHIFMQSKIRSAEALELGIISEIIAQDQLLERACEMGNKMSELNPLTVSATKMLINDMEVSKINTYFQAYVCSLTSKMPYCKDKLEAFFNRKNNV